MNERGKVVYIMGLASVRLRTRDGVDGVRRDVLYNRPMLPIFEAQLALAQILTYFLGVLSL